ncbi:YhgE/Pip domain-containing protein [Allokutzneria sp. A3M-2-11 16]|uniref:YhgE/Pip domain-containing protein n=1 Tax=Allokutzneria sp. A3M-2-11 16 TaxID=2962043 RepID=UPI0020B80D31|nr:YhgE/Pip domain-containing protein [Allokutzneria sp. A3M-2-11 16]MCP3802493.1 YhgE/Pip domain-containing protein [Allokutzneria sp. A3M-2-11 16]
MTPFRLAANELRRLTAGKLPRLAVLAITLVPLLYGALYLYANWDPYGKLSEVPAALVVADTGASRDDGTELKAGQKIADKLDDSGTFSWTKTDAADADAGVRDGRYTFSITLPADFSQALLSPAEYKPRQGIIVMTTNDANNYLVSTIADKVVGEVRRAVSSEVGTEAADKLLVGFSTMREKTQQAAEGAGKLADGSVKVRDGVGTAREKINELGTGLTKLAEGGQKLNDGIVKLSGGLGELRTKTAELPTKSKQLADGAKQVSDGNKQLADRGAAVADAAKQLVDTLDGKRDDIAKKLRALGLPEEQVQKVLGLMNEAGKPLHQANDKVQGLSGQLKTLANGAKQVSDGAATLAAQTPRLSSAIKQLDDGAGQLAEKTPELRDGLKKASTGAGQLYDGTKPLTEGAVQVADGNKELAGKLGEGVETIPNLDEQTRKDTARTIGDPISVRAIGENKAGSYGAGLAPFFLGLASWIGAFVMFLLVRPLSRRALTSGAAPWRVALGGWLPAALLGSLQVSLLFLVVTTAIGVSPANPLGTLGFMVLTSLAFTAVLHGLNALLGPSGKFVALVLLVLQLTTAGGTFPWQTTPEPLHVLHLVLPLSYVVDGLRHLIYGGGWANMGTDIGVLGGYLIFGLLLAVLAAYKQKVWTPNRLKPELVL